MTRHRTLRRTTTTTVLAALAVFAIGRCDPNTVLPDRAHGSDIPPSTAAVPATLAVLPVAPEDVTAPYDRDQWGDWAAHGNGCDTRELVLSDQGRGTRPGNGCRPVCPRSGPPCWTSPYDSARLRDPSRVQIDHRVPLAEANRSGAAHWNRTQRERFFNDTANLVAASIRSNTSKGDSDPARWRPTNRAAWCGYATAYTTTKATYGLSIDPTERDALAAMLATCQEGNR